MSQPVEILRRVYGGALRDLCYDNAGRQAVAAAVTARVAELCQDGAEPTPVMFVRAICGVRIPCRRCMGSGAFTTRVENGQPRGPGGMCFRCEGRGYQTHEDGARNYGYDNYAMGRAF